MLRSVVGLRVVIVEYGVVVTKKVVRPLASG